MARIRAKRVPEQGNQLILEVRAVWTATEANELLATGSWIVTCAHIAHADAGGYQCKPLWMLSRIR